MAGSLGAIKSGSHVVVSSRKAYNKPIQSGLGRFIVFPAKLHEYVNWCYGLFTVISRRLKGYEFTMFVSTMPRLDVDGLDLMAFV